MPVLHIYLKTNLQIFQLACMDKINQVFIINILPC